MFMHKALPSTKRFICLDHKKSHDAITIILVT